MSLLSRFTFGIFHTSNFNYLSATSKHMKLQLIKRKSYLVPCLWKSTSPKSKSNSEQQPREVKPEAVKSEILSFQNMVESRRCESQRSILVQVHSEHSSTELHAYCSTFGDVKGLHHYSLPESLHFIVVEFEREDDVRNILSECTHVKNNQVVPVRSPLLWFRAADRSKSKKLTAVQPNLTLVEQFGNTSPSHDELRTLMLRAGSVSEQVTQLHQRSRLDDLGSRLRFLAARQMELALSGLFPLIRALPFGSSVNSFGRTGCDLDLVLQLDQLQDKVGRLVFHAKTCLANERTQTQRHMTAVADICETFLPGCSRVRRILQARVPIIKYRQDLMAVDCDLSVTNMCAVHMSELLYMWGNVDDRVQALVCAVRYWASQAGITNPNPGRWITNFSLTLMAIFFLQQAQVLPTLNTLITLAGPEDQRITAEGVNCTFLRNVSKLSPTATNTDNLEVLLFKFFEYFSGFDFGVHALSLAEGVPVVKPEHCALYIGNPLERGLNVSKNVSAEELERLRIELRNAAWCLESGMDVTTPTHTEPWGLVEMVERSSGLAGKHKAMRAGSSSARLVDVKQLFGEDEAVIGASDAGRKKINKLQLNMVQEQKPQRNAVKRRRR